MNNVNQMDIELYRQKIRQLSMQIPQKTARSREAIISSQLFDEIDNLRKAGHEWSKIAASFGQEIKWKSLQSSFSREKKRRSKSKRNSAPIAPPPPPPPPPPPAAPLPTVNLKF